MQHVFDAVELERVPGVRATLKTRNHIIFGRQYIHNFSLAFIPPLKA